MSSGRLGELLVRENLISVQQLRKAQEEQQKNGTRIGTALIKTGAIEESKLTDFLSQAVRRAGDQPEGLRHRSGDHQAGAEGGGARSTWSSR